jgi:hypothetical protein
MLVVKQILAWVIKDKVLHREEIGSMNFVEIPKVINLKYYNGKYFKFNSSKKHK